MQEFFDQLAVFSDRYVKVELGLDSALSTWGGESGLKPKGAVIHFTADEDPHRVLRWFLREKYKSRVSAHVVVFDRKLGTTDELAHDLPLVRELPATVIQCRLPSQRAWHATWVNDRCYGVENVCAGEVREGVTGSFSSWRPRDKSSAPWTMPWNVPYKSPVHLRGRSWSPYTPAQVLTNIYILRHLDDVYPLDSEWVIGHECVQGASTRGARGLDKRDPGPGFPIGELRRALGHRCPVVGEGWLADYSASEDYANARDDQCVSSYASLFTKRGVRPTLDIAWAKFESDVRALPHRISESFDPTGFLGLELLGYAPGTLKSVRIFQRMMGLKVDGDPGPATRNALVARLDDRGVFAR